MGKPSAQVVIGMDPHKRSVTIEVMTSDESVVGTGRFGTDRDGLAALLRFVAAWPQRVWAIEGCSGIGRHVALRLLGQEEQVVDVPPKLSARARMFATGQGRKTDATDAHSVALVGTRMAGLRPVVNDEQLAVLRVLVDRRRSLGDEHTRKMSQVSPPAPRADTRWSEERPVGGASQGPARHRSPSRPRRQDPTPRRRRAGR
jgi:transposase